MWLNMRSPSLCGIDGLMERFDQTTWEVEVTCGLCEMKSARDLFRHMWE